LELLFDPFKSDLVYTQHLLGNVLLVTSLFGSHFVLVAAMVEYAQFAFVFHEVDVDIPVDFAEYGPRLVIPVGE